MHSFLRRTKVLSTFLGVVLLLISLEEIFSRGSTIVTTSGTLYAHAFISSPLNAHMLYLQTTVRSSNNFRKNIGSTQQYYNCPNHFGKDENFQRQNLFPTKASNTMYASNNENHDIKISEIEDDVQTIQISKREQVKNLFRRLWLKLPFVTLAENSKEIEEIYENEFIIYTEKDNTWDTSSAGQDNVNSIILQDSQIIEMYSSELVAVSMDSTNTNTTELISTELESSKALETPTESPPSIISTTDLSGTWKPKVTNQFKSEYDEYLLNCSQPFMFRKVIVNGIAFQKEIIQQHGNDLQITATNPAGNWDRTLVYNETLSIKDPDGDLVTVESAWEDEGKVHRSWLRNKPRVHGGVFDTRRYLDSDVDELVCESQFIPATGSEDRFKFGHVIWRFERC